VVLDFIDVPDRRLTRAAAELVGREVEDPGTHVTTILPRRSYSALLGRLLHDRTADKIAEVVSRIPRSAALEIRPVEQNSVLALEISDSTGDLTALFYGRSHIAGVVCGSHIRLRGPVGIRDRHPVMINPAYELVSSGPE